jgi:NAD(P)-dependent dehydrogenase (short-subunit alcohol dehydrogenase family)
MEPNGPALVTGASRGLGRAVALELAARGFDVLATMRAETAGADLPGLAAARGGRLGLATLDLDDPARFEPPAGLRVLVANAGVRGPYLPVEDDPVERWRSVFETNVFGTYEVVRRCIPAMRDAGGGVICLVTTSSLLVPMPFFGAYRASKAAVSALGETLRAELAPHGIRILEILPGPIDTDLMADSVLRRAPEAIAFEPYRELAERAYPHDENGRSAAADYPIATPAQAAVAIADAIADDDAPLRVGCDPWSVGALAAWRGHDDESHHHETMARWQA